MKENNQDWFNIKNIDAIDSPALIVYPEKVERNIDVAVSMIDDITRLRPHIKTCKCKEAIELMMRKGITKFKCATIAEAEMLAMCKAKDVLLAYQPNDVKIHRFISLIKKYPDTFFSCLTDNAASAESIDIASFQAGITIFVYIDINTGMNRTGITSGEEAKEFFLFCCNKKNIKAEGFHVYDGHLHTEDIDQRTKECNDAYLPVERMIDELFFHGYDDIKIIAGGSPTFPIHAQRKDVECSPGTFIYWDKGYETICPEQKFSPAALVIARIISLPAEDLICIDLGHKSIAAEKDLQHRVHFIDAPELFLISQSEEHLVARTTIGHSYKIGDVLYGIPYHICPTVALYERAITIEDHLATGEWKTIARDRKISI